MGARRRLPESFYLRDAATVARDLIGRWLRRDSVILEITEVEAYLPDDSACHGRFGRTARNAAMWGPGGRAYVYLCYGLHDMLNVVTGPEGEAAAVLIRSARPVARVGGGAGAARWEDRPVLLTGPGKVGAALALDPSWSHHALFERGGLELLSGEPAERWLHGPRVGIDYAAPVDRDALLRFAAVDTPWVSHRKTLRSG
ncbi:MAG: DNA-3-methyladenine glycosylase [Deltaproteobacteria bacterium]|nr:DNA-3-methyladenine glycosylase [Deltaproteobacteria bacterium]